VSEKQATLNISLEVKGEPGSVKSPGQSYDGLIQELVKFWKEKRPAATGLFEKMEWWSVNHLCNYSITLSQFARIEVKRDR